jgi:hypothetical protein
MNQSRDSRAGGSGGEPPLGEGNPKPPLRGDYIPPPGTITDKLDDKLPDLAAVTEMLVYVGNKEWAMDVYGNTGISWDGKGDVKAVPIGVAKKLLRHPDEWMLASDMHDKLPTPQERREAERKAAELAEKEREKAAKEVDNFRNKTKDELVAYARKYLDINLDIDLSHDEMVKKIEEAITNEHIDDANKRRNEVIGNEGRKGR